MALKWLDGAELGGGGFVARKYTGGDTVSTSTPRLSPGTASYSLGGNVLVTPSLGVQTTWYVGFGLKLNAANDFSWRFMTAADQQCRLVSVRENFTADYRLQLVRGDGTVISTTSQVFEGNVWHYFELRVDVRSGTNGSYELRRNETAVMSGSGVNLAGAGVDGCDIHTMFGTGGSIALDDIYICDSTGTENNGFLGDSVVVGLLPESDGAQSDWTRSAGTTGYNLLDETSSPNDGDFISADAAGSIDLFDLPALPTTGIGTIRGVSVEIAASLDGIGTRSMRPKYREAGGATGDGDDFTVDGTTVVEHVTIMEQNPVTNAAWTRTDIDDGQFGVELN